MKDVTLKQLLEAGAHFGHQVRRWNPAMKPFVYGVRDGVHIFDLVLTKKGLDDACRFLKKTAGDGGVIIFVGTKRQAKDTVKETAIKVGMPYAVERWPAGFLTNFDQLNKSLRKLKDLKEQREKGELKKYTKREQLLIDRDIYRLEKFLGGLVAVEKKPDALFVVDTKREEVAVKEAVRMGIPVVGMVDTNGDPTQVDFVIPTNDDAVGAIDLIVRSVGEAIEESKSKSKLKGKV
ncbi:MAG: 30S ribosomal protein S2 [Candidatus Amesbacteria bacterium GW2011_GWB1_47_19]|nr:MAG: 30S ribosomal protein S2 [Candidatus Amesbacteria bacterium GW2011_GWA1_44_24]KKU31451.1 MAG: 30S ribosomal protein S2 [Candidatus Amesbacteria bacterium GW2011_GWC1_46_24]KKU67459.1 MAG: 30S ribosomal protein S2 [Candidatus Amesbacteria bacterium GW2011_GWB1_47_19]OGD05108.1 MAG: 30S ribosomal protein S2 [Candidatus Amesbacteria bacterium RIFOXYB1_FULL_47_13]HBC72466.1 30S ribosomal protein S2 [Candidatus Amesbacteria bacterium]